MAIAAYSELLPSMNVRLPDCSAAMIEQALWLAGREFCLETEAYIVTLDSIDGVADQKEYTLTIPTQFDPIRVFEVRRLTEDEVTDGDKGTKIEPSEFDFHIFTNILEFAVAPFQENITDGLVVKLVLAPQEDGDDTELDFDWIRRWSRYIKAGAFHHLFSMPQSPWYSQAEAGKWYDEFRKGIGYARREVKIQGTTRQLRIAGGAFL